MNVSQMARATFAAMLCFLGATMLSGQTVIKSDWPKDRVPADIPVYPYAGVTDHGPSSDAYWIKVADGKPASVARYVALMTAKGWVDERRGSLEFLKKGDETVEVRVFPDDNLTMLIISVFKPPRIWPTEGFPELPELGKGTYTFYTDPESGTTITVGRVTEADVVAYFTLLTTKGWQGNPEELLLKRSSPRALTIIAEENGEDEWSLSLAQE
jgi:hypothetical protein